MKPPQLGRKATEKPNLESTRNKKVQLKVLETLAISTLTGISTLNAITAKVQILELEKNSTLHTCLVSQDHRFDVNLLECRSQADKDTIRESDHLIP